MRSPRIIGKLMFSLLIIFLTANLPYANPLAPMPITEVHYQDSLHWVVEFNPGELFYMDTIPDETDMITLGCVFDPFNGIQMQSSVVPVHIDTANEIGVITPEHFPSLKLLPGGTIYIGTKDNDYPDEGPKLPGNLQSGYTITLNVYKGTCYEYIGGLEGNSYSCTKREYVTSECPTENTGTGRITGVLTEIHKIPHPSFMVLCFADLHRPPIKKTQTKPDGSFQLSGLPSCPPLILRFSLNGFHFDYVTKPLSTEEQSERELTVQFQFPTTGIGEKKTQSSHRKPAVCLLSSSGSNGNAIFVSISDNSIRGNGICELYSLNGELIRSRLFTGSGIGTYTITWGSDNQGDKIPSASYLCRVTIGSEVVCKKFISR